MNTPTPSDGNANDGTPACGTKIRCPESTQRVEIREITIAQGIDFNNANLIKHFPYLVIPYGLVAPLSARGGGWPESMKDRPPLEIIQVGNTFSHYSRDQGVDYRVTVVTSKTDFRQALLTPNRHVIYGGHSRYGRGPCFGPNPSPGEDWENGSTPATGLFRMGWRFIGVPARDLIHHGYTANPVSSSVSRHEVERGLGRKLKSLRARSLGDILREMSTLKVQPLIGPLRVKNMDATDPATTWWSYQAAEKLTIWSDGKWQDVYQLEPHVVLHAGWRGTANAPADLGATTPACRVFCHFGCSSRAHFMAILRDRAFKGWRPGADERLARFTTNLSYNHTVGYWLYHLFTFTEFSAFGKWGPSLDYATEMVNLDLDRDKLKFHIKSG
jgi:hypothetical protein